MQKLPSPLLHSHNFWSFSSTSENHTRACSDDEKAQLQDSSSHVRFQKEMRLVTLERPEPGATGYQNLMRQNPKLTRSRATRSALRPKCPQSQPKKSIAGPAAGSSPSIATPNSTQSRYLPPPAAPDWMASRNRVTLIEPDAWLGGYSLNVARNCPTICTAGTIVHNLSPHQRAYISDSLW
jgi:hypothetical protein